MAYKYLVDLIATEQTYLLKLIHQGKPSARKMARAQVLLHAADGSTDDKIAQALHLGVSTVHRTRQRLVDDGLMPTLSEKSGAEAGRLFGVSEATVSRLVAKRRVE